jgi:hypothetical protein
MNLRKVSKVFFVFVIILFIVNPAAAQEKIIFKINYLIPEGGYSDVQEKTIERLTEKFLAKGYEIGKYPEWNIFLNIYHLDKPGTGKIIISYTLSQSLPKPIIDFGVKNEVFYLPAEKREKKEGQSKEIREYVTSEFLHQFFMLLDNKLYVVENSEIDSKLNDIVEEIDELINLGKN